MLNNNTEQKQIIASPMPFFENELINELYRYDFRIPADVLNQLLDLPEESLAADLKKVLEDSVKRYKYFSETPGITEEETNFLLHAILLIAEKKRVDLLPDILNILQQDMVLLRFYLNDLITEVIWIALYKLCVENPTPLFDLLKKPNIYTYSKTPANQALTQLYYHHPHLQPLIINGYKVLTTFFIEHEDDEDLIDNELIADVVCAMRDISLAELNPDIKLLYQHELVFLGYAGNYESLTTSIERLWHKEKIPGIVELYHEAITTWNSYQEDFFDDDFFDEKGFDKDFFDDDFSDDDREIQQSIVRSEPKIGRNDPCPCGSGKKYKKCCLNLLE